MTAIERRKVIIPTKPGDRVGEQITLTATAWITSIEADLIDAGSLTDTGSVLPGEQWTTLMLDRLERVETVSR